MSEAFDTVKVNKPLNEFTLNDLYTAMTAELNSAALLLIKGLPEEAQVHATMAQSFATLIQADRIRRLDLNIEPHLKRIGS